MYKISPSTLESYRIFKYDLYGKSERQFIEELTSPFVETEAMRYGKLIHKYLESPKDAASEFVDEEREQLDAIRALIPAGVSEVYTRWEHRGIRFNMQIDKLVGTQVHEFKTGKQFHGVDHYDASLQWKLYLLGTGAQSATYHCITYGETRPAKFKYNTPFTFFPYAGMDSEVVQYAEEFIEFCKHHGIAHIIEVKDEPESQYKIAI